MPGPGTIGEGQLTHWKSNVIMRKITQKVLFTVSSSKFMVFPGPVLFDLFSS